VSKNVIYALAFFISVHTKYQNCHVILVVKNFTLAAWWAYILFLLTFIIFNILLYQICRNIFLHIYIYIYIYIYFFFISVQVVQYKSKIYLSNLQKRILIWFEKNVFFFNRNKLSMVQNEVKTLQWKEEIMRNKYMYYKINLTRTERIMWYNKLVYNKL